MHNFRQLDNWKRARYLVKDIYLACNKLPKYELYRLTAQMTRCAVSIPSNIAEGCGRDTDKQTVYFLSIALGSSFELETQVLLANDLEYFSKELTDKLVEDIQHVQRMTRGFKKKLERNIK
ncbi:MAG: four helix bundle protein [Saprospiraceae bacterium]